MAHELSIRANGKAEMAFSGELPWHGLGQKVTQGASIGVWLKEAGMDWEANESPVIYNRMRADGQINQLDSAVSKMIYRGDTGAELGVVGAGYNIVQPAQVLEFFRDLTEAEGWHIQTAGVLRGGRKLWAMAGQDGASALAAKGDRINLRLLMATSLDGSMKTTAALVAERVVCANTLAVALGEHGRQRVEVSHRSIFNPQAVKRQLGVASDAFARFMRQAQELAQTPIATEEALQVLRAVFGAPPASPKIDLSWLSDSLIGDEPDTDEKESRNTERAMALFEGDGLGADSKGSAGTRWGLLNAVTELVDHEMGRSDDTRIDSAWFGRGKDFKAAAFKELTADLAL